MGKRAIVLAGGGSRGAYQIGVWRALREMNIQYQIVTGASVGALNGAMMAQGDYQRAAELWGNLQTGDVVNFDIPSDTADYGKAGWELDVWMAFIRKAAASGGADFSPLEKIIADAVDENRVRSSGVDFGLVTVEFPSMKAAELPIKRIPKGKLGDFLVASAACFPAFKRKDIDGTAYIDGGYHDNIPVNLALSMGAEEVLAVDLEGIGIVQRPKNSRVPIRYIRSYWSLGPFLWFDPSLSRRNMELGYLDAKRAFHLIDGWAYAFEPGAFPVLRTTLSSASSRLMEDIRCWAEAGSPGTPARGRAVRFRMQKALSKRRGRLRRTEELLLAAAEIAGEQLELEPTRLWTMEQFHQALLDAFQPLEGLAEQTLKSLRSEQLPVREIIDRVLREGRKQAVSFCYREFSRAAAERSLPPRFWTLCALAPEAVIAAVYLFLLRKRTLPPSILP